MDTISNKILKMYEMAKEVREKSYSPYSKFKVGAAILANGKIFTGTNIENASFGATICSERVAIVKAVSEGKKNITDIVIVLNSKKLGVPCGMCLQVMAEFCDENTKIWLGNSKRLQVVFNFTELLTHPFGPKHLK